MFTSGHFIWFGALSVLIIVGIVLSKKLGPSQRTVERIVCCLLIPLKIMHVCLSMKASPDGGLVVDQTQLSFHLCSIMIYCVIIINFIKNEKVLAQMKSFMTPCLLIGAFMALLIPTEGVDPSVPRVWQYMLIHGTLVFFGFYLMLVEKVDLTFKAFLHNLKLLLVVVVFGFLMNSVLEQYNTNFLFLRKPPMEGLPILNLDNGWYIYFVSLALVACTLLFLVQLPYYYQGDREERKIKTYKKRCASAHRFYTVKLNFPK